MVKGQVFEHCINEIQSWTALQLCNSRWFQLKGGEGGNVLCDKIYPGQGDDLYPQSPPHGSAYTELRLTEFPSLLLNSMDKQFKFSCVLLPFLSLVIYLGSPFNGLSDNIHTRNRDILPCTNARAYCFPSQGEGKQPSLILFLGQGKGCKSSRLQEHTENTPLTPHSTPCSRLTTYSQHTCKVS